MPDGRDHTAHQAMLKEQYRKARRERIAAGKASSFDLWDEEEIVCPYCGSWQIGYETEDVLPLTKGNTRYETVCRSCKQSFMLTISVNLRYASEKLSDYRIIEKGR